MSARREHWIVVAGCVLAACGGGGTAKSAANEAENAPPAGERNACRLLTHPEVAALVEKQVAIADVTEASPTFSSCQWEDAAGTFLFGIDAYWAGGKQQWEAWRTAQGLGAETWKQQEGVNLDSIVKQGPVVGLGDGAYFSELLPALVLQGDRLIEMKLVIVPNAAAKFRPLATKLLSRM